MFVSFPRSVNILVYKVLSCILNSFCCLHNPDSRQFRMKWVPKVAELVSYYDSSPGFLNPGPGELWVIALSNSVWYCFCMLVKYFIPTQPHYVANTGFKLTVLLPAVL